MTTYLKPCEYYEDYDRGMVEQCRFLRKGQYENKPELEKLVDGKLKGKRPIG